MPQPHFLQPKKIVRRSLTPHPQFLNSASVDPYSGCEFGCLYCYAVKEDIIDDNKGPSPFHVGIKTNCAFSLQKELASGRPGAEIDPAAPAPILRPGSLGIGYSTDPYQPCEEKFQLTQRCLEILETARCPIQILTKSDLILRDKKLLARMSEQGLVIVSISLFTLDEKLSEQLEPRVLPPKKRLDLIEELKKSNIECGAMLMPIFPFLSDDEDELRRLFSSLSSHGASYCVPSILSLSREAVRNRITPFLEKNFPDILERYRNLYDFNGVPSPAYCERLQEMLESFSKTYKMPLMLPVKDHSGKTDLVMKDGL